MSRLWNTDEDIRSLKSLILFGIRGMAAYAYHAMILGYFNPEVNDFFYRGLFALSMDWGMEELLPLVLETGKINLLCMELLDRANTETFETLCQPKFRQRLKKVPLLSLPDTISMI